MAKKEPRFFLRIGMVGSAGAVEHKFDAPESVYERWCKVEFQFKATPQGFETTHVQVHRDNMIWVKERWFHKVWSWLCFRFKKPKPPAFAKEG